MLNWQEASESDQRLGVALEWIFRNDIELLELLFESSSPNLKDEPENLLSKIGCFSSGEQILIRVALDLWSGSGGARFWDVIHRLDGRHKMSVIVALGYLRIIPAMGAQSISTIKIGPLSTKKNTQLVPEEAMHF